MEQVCKQHPPLRRRIYLCDQVADFGVVVQVKPFRKLRQVHNLGKRTRVRDLIRYDMRQMHAAFTGTLPVGSTAESLGHTQVHGHRTLNLKVMLHTYLSNCSHKMKLFSVLGRPSYPPYPMLPPPPPIASHLGQPTVTPSPRARTLPPCYCLTSLAALSMANDQVGTK